MEKILQHEIFEFHPDTFLRSREACSLEAPGRMDEAVGLLRDWASKQEHFLKKEFPTRYLETTLLMSKGSVEKAKKKLDMLCTMKTLVPRFFGKIDAKNEFKNLHASGQLVMLPRLTDDHYRVAVLKLTGKFYPSYFQDICQYIVIMCEHCKLYDYCKGVIYVLDPGDANIVEFVTHYLSLTDLRDMSGLVTKAFGARIKSMYYVSPSKTAEIFISVVKHAISAKLVSRISIVKSAEELHQHLPKRILPEDLGGEERSMQKLYDEWLDVYSSEQVVKQIRELQEARTDEALRRIKLDDAYGLPGTFRALNVD